MNEKTKINFIDDAQFLVNLQGKTLVITSCSKLKNGHRSGITLPAKDLYAGRILKKVRQYSEIKGFDYMILSAKYGLIPPDEKISGYDKVLRSKKDVEVIKNQVSHAFRKVSADYESIIVVAGKNYRLALQDVWDTRFFFIKTNGIALMQKIVNDAVKLLTIPKLEKYPTE